MSDFIKDLEMSHELELWELRKILPYDDDTAKVRRVDPVEIGRGNLPISSLRNVVQPEDVALSVVAEPVYDEDDDWIRSTDPLHPISTNYEVSCAGIDEDYLKTLTEELTDNAQFMHDTCNSIATSWDCGSDSVASGIRFEELDESSESRWSGLRGRYLLIVQHQVMVQKTLLLGKKERYIVLLLPTTVTMGNA